MRRRQFIMLVGGIAVAWPSGARTQQPDRMRRVAVLMPFAETDPEGKVELAAFAEQLQKLGWSDGGNIHIDYRYTDGDKARMAADADELIGLQPDVVFSRSTPATVTLAQKTKTIPIVFAVVSDPVGDGLVASVARPGGNVTGFTNAESTLTAKWLGLLKETTPGLARVLYLFDPHVAPGGGRYYTTLVETAAPSAGVTPVAAAVHSKDDIEHAIDEFVRIPNGGLVVLPDASTNFYRQSIIALAARHRLPAIYAFRNLAEEGGLMSYGIDVPELFRRAADYVDRILKGAKPADLPVQLPEKFEFVINLKTAKALGLSVPPGVFAIADQVIE